jgi:hypothetical protein
MSRAKNGTETETDGYARDISVCDVDARLTSAVVEVVRPDGYVERIYLSETEAEIVEDGLREAREGSV